MKHILFFSVLIFFVGCFGTGNDETEDHAPTVVNPIPNKVYEFGTQSETLPLGDVFHDQDNDPIHFSASSGNTALVSTSINGTELVLTFPADVTGSTEISVIATANEKSAEDKFTVTISENPNKAPIIQNPIENTLLDFGTKEWVQNISSVFSDPNNDALSYSVSYSNSAFITHAEINGVLLNIRCKETQVDSSDIFLTATDGGGKSVTDTFRLVMETNPVEYAGTLYQEGSYQEAEKAFKEMLFHSNVDVVAKAYVGLGFTQIMLEKKSDALQQFKDGLNLATTVADMDLNAGICFLEFVLNDNYIASVDAGEKVLSASTEFKMLYDTSINAKDVRLVVAQSYFQLLQYEHCLKEVQTLGKLQNVSASDTQLIEKLLDAMRVLANELK